MALKGYEKSGRLLKFFGWLGIVVAVAAAAGVALPAAKAGKTTEGILVGGAILALVGGLSWFQICVGQGVKEHKHWARTAGIVLSVFQLFGFPIGTLIGAYILFNLFQGWDAPAPEVNSQA